MKPFRFQWRDAVLSAVGPDPSMRLVLLALENHVDAETNETFVGSQRLQEETGLSLKTVQDRLRKAVKDGWLHRKNRDTNGQGWRRYVFELLLPERAARVTAASGKVRYLTDKGAVNQGATCGNGGIKGAVAVTDEQNHLSKTKNKTRAKANEPVSSFAKTDDFEVFWNLYPKKVNRNESLRAWQDLSPGDDLKLSIFRAIEEQTSSDQWADDDGKFIPAPANWLRDERWDDELSGIGWRVPSEKTLEDYRQEAERLKGPTNKKNSFLRQFDGAI